VRGCASTRARRGKIQPVSARFETKRRTIITTAAVAGVIGPLLFGTILLALSALQYDFMVGIGWRPVADPAGAWPSGLALGPYGTAQIASFAVSGLLLAFFALGLRDRAVALFESLMDSHPALLCDHDATSFMYYGSYDHFSRMEPHVRALMNHGDEKCAQRGAELICVAAISSANALGSDEDLSTARALAESAVTGPPALRRGAAQIYARNMDSRQSDACARELIRLLDDEDDAVRRLVGSAFSHARGVGDPGTRRFVEEFAASRALAGKEDDFAEYLWEYGPDDSSWALSVLEAALDNRHSVGPIRRGGEQFVRLVLRIYTDPTADATIGSRAMDAFDRVMERYAYEAQRALEEWDRR
jgi:hypothetical protein